jgi:NDP-sugar pyrophosphorylase family protein
MTLPVALLAGGLATRLHPITATIPKSLVEVAGRPFIEHQLLQLRGQGYRSVVICVGHLGGLIEKAVGDGSRLGMHVSYSHEGERLLGTGGALRNAASQLGERFLVMYGDSYLSCDYAAVEQAFQQSFQPALMTVFRNDGKYGESNVVYRDGRIIQYDKSRPTGQMRYIDYGLSALAADVLRPYAAGTKFDLSEVFHHLAAAGRLAAFEVADRFYEIGSAAGLEETRRHLAGSREVG